MSNKIQRAPINRIEEAIIFDSSIPEETREEPPSQQESPQKLVADPDVPVLQKKTKKQRKPKKQAQKQAKK